MSTKQEQRRELWRQRIAEQESSGQLIRAYCRERELNESAFYGWRGRLRKQKLPVRFALVETKPAVETAPPLELLLASGDRLRILQKVLDGSARFASALGYRPPVEFEQQLHMPPPPAQA